MIAKIIGPGHQISHYTISDGDMAVGSTFGAPKGTLIIKATGALEKVYSCEAGIDMFGSMVLHHWDQRSGIPLTAAPGEFVIHPHHQEHNFEIADHIAVREDVFMMNGMPQGEKFTIVDPPAAYFTVELQNQGDETIDVATYASIRLRGGFADGTRATYDAARHAFIVHNQNFPELVRIAACSIRPTSYEVSLDSAKTSAAQFPGRLSNAVVGSSENPIGIFHLEHRLKPGALASFYFVLTFSLEGDSEAMKTLQGLPSAARALERTTDHFQTILNRAVVLTPDSEVNRGVLWAKANMLRSESRTSQGWCFTNDPVRSNNSVGRDTAWFGFGADYVMPHFAHESLLWYADHLESNGMVVEYFDIRNGQTEDYGLNINDDTPLLILALWHHYNVTGDRAFLQYAYPKAERAAKYILSQRNDKGLIWCTADASADWGIVGWRNVIEGYRLSGATTEVNSECFAALKTMSMMAQELGNGQAAGEFTADADALRAAINEHLLDKNRNLYYLNIDLDGTPRTDVTCDLVFPVMFGVADHDVAANIIARLSIPEFWSDAGLHTVPRHDINYSPARGYGLTGGVWAGPTFWFAFAAASFNPEFMAYALSVSFRHYSQDPRRNNTVPGQFSEWLHGETLTNQGMMLSPWFAPKYLWAAIEGAAGLDLGANPPTLNPRPASTWSWMGVRNVPLRGKPITWFVVRTDGLRVYTTHPFPSVDVDRVYETDISEQVRVSGENAVHFALQRPGRTVIFIGNTKDRTITTSLSVQKGCLPGRYLLRHYNTLRGEWIEIQDFDGARLQQGMPIQVSQRGFGVVELFTQT